MGGGGALAQATAALSPQDQALLDLAVRSKTAIFDSTAELGREDVADRVQDRGLRKSISDKLIIILRVPSS